MAERGFTLAFDRFESFVLDLVRLHLPLAEQVIAERKQPANPWRSYGSPWKWNAPRGRA